MHLTYPYRRGSFAAAAVLPVLSAEAKKRLAWMDYCRKTRNASLTCRHFGISRQCFYEWKKRYDPFRLTL